MKGLESSLRVLLIAAMMAAAIPYQHPADLHRDGSIDLRDAIVAMRQVDGGGQDPSPLMGRLRTAVTTLEVAAGLKTIIKTDAAGGLTAQASSLPPVLLVHVAATAPVSMQLHRLAEPAIFATVDSPPPTPPPRLS